MIQTAEAYVVACTVAANDPLRAFHEVLLQALHLLVDRVFAMGNGIDNLVAQLAALAAVVHVIEPLLIQGLHLGSFALAGNGLLDIILDTCTHLLVGYGHAQAKLAEVFKQRVGPCRTMTLGVGAIGGRRHSCRVDRRAACGIGHHLAVAKELRDEFHIGRLSATGAGAVELKEGSGKL